MDIFLDPIIPFKDEELVKYMSKRIEKEKGMHFSDIRNLLHIKFEGLPDDKLQEEKDSLFLRKTALEHAGLENIATIAVSVTAIVVAILAFLNQIIRLDQTFSILQIGAFLMLIIVSITAFFAIYQIRLFKRASEIAYCTLALEEIKKIKPEIFN